MMKLRFQISISYKEHKPNSKYILEKSGAQEESAIFLQKAIKSKLPIKHSKEV